MYFQNLQQFIWSHTAYIESLFVRYERQAANSAFDKSTCPQTQSPSTPVYKVNMSMIVGIIILLACGCLLGASVLVVELL